MSVILRRKLNWWQIYSIVISGIIGIGFVTGAGTILAIVGPGGTVLAFAIVGAIACLVMEGISEMIVLWPIPNAMVEFVRTFVDEDLGMAIGVAYWLTYTITFNAILVNTINLAGDWSVPVKGIAFSVAPIILLFINLFKVEWFGWIETFGGIVKIALVLLVFGLMIAVNRGLGAGEMIAGKYWDSTSFWHHNPHVASWDWQAMFIAIPQAIFAYIGIELITTTAFEASNARQLKWPAMHISWQVTLLYIMVTTTFVFNVDWIDDRLPKLYGQGSESHKNTTLSSIPIPIIPLITDYPAVADVLRGILMYSGFSAANTGLYVASRAFYGMARMIDVDHNHGPTRIRRALAHLSDVLPSSGAPFWGVTVSALILWWLPFVHLKTDVGKQQLQTVLMGIGSVGGLLVWSSQCIAFIRYDSLRTLHRDRIRTSIDPLRRRLRKDGKQSLISIAQPGPAYLGAVGALLVVFLFNTAVLWNGKNSPVKVLSCLSSPLLILVLWMIFKFKKPKGRRQWFTNLSRWEDFDGAMQRLDDMIHPEDRSTSQPVDSSSRSNEDLPHGTYQIVSNTVVHLHPKDGPMTNRHPADDGYSCGGDGDGRMTTNDGRRQHHTSVAARSPSTADHPNVSETDISMSSPQYHSAKQTPGSTHNNSSTHSPGNMYELNNRTQTVRAS